MTTKARSREDSREEISPRRHGGTEKKEKNKPQMDTDKHRYYPDHYSFYTKYDDKSCIPCENTL
jgi:hypothetical protein